MSQLRGGLSNERAAKGRGSGLHMDCMTSMLCNQYAIVVAFEMGTAVSKILDRLKDEGGLQGKDIANIVSVSPATVSRWSSGKATPDLKTQTVIAELRYVVDRLADFYTPDESRLWLHARHPMLGNMRAIDLINNGRTEEVLAVIEALELRSLHISDRALAPGSRPGVTGRSRRVPARAFAGRGLAHCQGWPRSYPWRSVAKPMVQWNVRCSVHLAGTRRRDCRNPLTAFAAAGVSVATPLVRLQYEGPPTQPELSELATLARLGVGFEHRYSDRDYSRTQPIADAAFFLGFDALLAPSARWPCSNLVLFTDRLAPQQIEVAGEPQPIDLERWRSAPRQ